MISFDKLKQASSMHHGYLRMLRFINAYLISRKTVKQARAAGFCQGFHAATA